MSHEPGGLSCPSAQPDMQGARVFGVLTGTPEEPRVAYLKQDAVVDGSMLDDLKSTGGNGLLYCFATK